LAASIAVPDPIQAQQYRGKFEWQLACTLDALR
jgi:hypothetical protein